jgi:acyl-CoA synthetase (AMP-forming)/AMP-acid ligase II
MLKGLMQDYPLTITALMRHAESQHGATEIVSVTTDNPRHRYHFADAFLRARKLANALAAFGLREGDRVGTLAWNDYRHFELYYGISCSGGVCHTLNPRLFIEQIEYIINHAGDRWLFVDPMFVKLLESLADRLPTVEGYVILTDEANMPATSLPNVIAYEALLNQHSDRYDWPELDENAACSLCYTSGTTGDPKGVLYSHRALVLHTFSACMPDQLNVGTRDVVLPIVPMFHVNAWSIPYAAAAAGFKLVMPGSHMGNPETLQALIEEESVNLSAGVPTVWLNLLNYLRETGKPITSLKRIIVGGSACPLSIMEEFEQQHGVYTHSAWGMTETSPLGAVNTLRRPRADYTDEAFNKLRIKAGRAPFGVEMKIVGPDGETLPWDGVAFGALRVRGPWICSDYYQLEDAEALDEEGWLDSGDVATIDPEGYMQITDRTKDVIKSGGEWISTIELENTAVGHPDIVEAAVIGIAHAKWDERPLLVAVKKEGSALTGETLLAWMEGKVARWWLPNAVEFVQELPHTATGKLQKVNLRQQFANYRFEDDQSPE